MSDFDILRNAIANLEQDGPLHAALDRVERVVQAAKEWNEAWLYDQRVGSPRSVEEAEAVLRSALDSLGEEAER